MEFQIGQVCEKLSGKERGSICVVISIEGNNLVTIDGNVRRRKCNVQHLKPLNKILSIKANEKTDKIKELMKQEGFDIIGKKIKVKERLRIRREAKKEENGK